MKVLEKLLTKTDVSKRLSVPSKCLKNFPRFERSSSHTVDLKVKDGSGCTWTFRCSVRNRGHLKPVVSGDWHRFVATKELSIGDQVKLFKEEEDPLALALAVASSGGSVQYYYRVEVKKAIKLFGKVIGHAHAIN